nr:MAG TPA: hypothetical protein [Caudoviricetes sp.]
MIFNNLTQNLIRNALLSLIVKIYNKSKYCFLVSF